MSGLKAAHNLSTGTRTTRKQTAHRHAAVVNPLRIHLVSLLLALFAGLSFSVHAAPTSETSGTLEVLYEDFANSARLRYYLHANGGRTELQFEHGSPRLETGMQLRVKGQRNGRVFSVGTAEDDVLILNAGSEGGSSGSASGPVNTTGAQNTIVLLVNFQDNPAEPTTIADTNNLVFGTVSDFYLESSYGQAWLTGSVHGWYTLSHDSSTCDPAGLADQADAAATADGVNMAAYGRIIYIYPGNGCNHSGQGTVGGFPTRVWINGANSLDIIAHELGHNFGLHHSHALDCGMETLASNCSSIEYGDSIDIMGNPGPGHFAAFQKQRIGWLADGDPDGLLTVTSDGSYALDVFETGGSGSKALRVPKGIDPVSGEQTWYYIEYRQAAGFDGFLADRSYDGFCHQDVTHGLVVHLGTDNTANSSYLLYMKPDGCSVTSYGEVDWEDPALAIGNSFTDPDTGLTINAVGADGTQATVAISFGTQTCVSSSPSLSISPAQGGVDPGTAVTYTMTVTNNNNTNCPTANFDLAASAPNGWSTSISNPVVTLSSGTSISTNLTVVSASSAADGIYTIDVTAQNSTDTTLATSNTVTYVVSATPEAPQNSAPVANNDSVSTSGTSVTVTVLANDSDPDNDSLTVISASQGTKGSVVINADGTVTYTPGKRFKNGDSFSYTISDGALSATATVTVSKSGDSSGGGSGKGGGGKGGGKKK